MNFDQKVGKGEMLANTSVPLGKLQRRLLLDEIDKWLLTEVEPGNGELPGLARYRRARHEDVEVRVRAKKEEVLVLLREEGEYV